MNTKTEFRDTIIEALEEYGETQLNISSPIARGLVAKSVEQKIKGKFHIFRINRLYTDKPVEVTQDG
jgi:hypothetical protein